MISSIFFFSLFIFLYKCTLIQTQKNVKLVITEVEAIEYKLISLITKNSG